MKIRRADSTSSSEVQHLRRYRFLPMRRLAGLRRVTRIVSFSHTHKKIGDQNLPPPKKWGTTKFPPKKNGGPKICPPKTLIKKSKSRRRESTTRHYTPLRKIRRLLDDSLFQFVDSQPIFYFTAREVGRRFRSFLSRCAPKGR